MMRKNWKLEGLRFRIGKRNRVRLIPSIMDFHLSPPSFATFNQQKKKRLAEEIGWDEAKDGMEWNAGEA